MVVDDDPFVLITLRSLFEPEGYEVYCVNSGQECLDELSRGFQGVVLMDIMMPHMDGWQTIREIVKRGYATGNVISMLTARGDYDPIAEDIRPYVKDYLLKPFDLKPLVNKVSKYFEKLEIKNPV